MIYILGGIAKSGKTTIAKEFNKRFNIPYFSTDYIMMMLNRGNPSLLIDPEEGDSIVAKKLEPYVYGMLKTMIENKVEYLIEGVHFNPDFSAKLIKEFPNDIRIVYLGFKDTSVVMKIFELNKYKEELENVWGKEVDFSPAVVNQWRISMDRLQRRERTGISNSELRQCRSHEECTHAWLGPLQILNREETQTHMEIEAKGVLRIYHFRYKKKR